MFKLDLEKAEEPEIKLPEFTGDHRKGKRIPEKESTSFSTLKSLTVWITTNWKILEEMGITDHVTCLLQNPCAGQEAAVRTRHGTIDGSKLGQEYIKVVYCHNCLFNLCAENIIQNIRLDEAQAGIKIAGRNIDNLRYTVTHPYGRK